MLLTVLLPRVPHPTFVCNPGPPAGGGMSRQSWVFLHKSPIKKMTHRFYSMPKLWKCFLSWGFHFSNGSPVSIWQKKKKLSNIPCDQSSNAKQNKTDKGIKLVFVVLSSWEPWYIETIRAYLFCLESKWRKVEIKHVSMRHHSLQQHTNVLTWGSS